MEELKLKFNKTQVCLVIESTSIVVKFFAHLTDYKGNSNEVDIAEENAIVRRTRIAGSHIS